MQYAGLIIMAVFTVILILAKLTKIAKWSWWWCALPAAMVAFVLLWNWAVPQIAMLFIKH